MEGVIERICMKEHKEGVVAELHSPKIHMKKSSPLVPPDWAFGRVTVFGDRVFKRVNKLKYGHFNPI